MKSLSMNAENVMFYDNDTVDPNQSYWLVKSSTSIHLYKIHLIIESCDQPLCRQKCIPCGICIYMFHCTCADNIIYFNICKHIHAVKQHGNLNLQESSDPQDVHEDVIKEEILPLLPREAADNQEKEEEIQALLQTMLGSMVAVKNLNDETYGKLKKKLLSCVSLINDGNSKQCFKAKDKINSRKGVSPQKRFPTCFKGRKREKIPQISVAQCQAIEKFLSSSRSVMIISSDAAFDHLY